MSQPPQLEKVTTKMNECSQTSGGDMGCHLSQKRPVNLSNFGLNSACLITAAVKFFPVTKRSERVEESPSRSLCINQHFLGKQPLRYEESSKQSSLMQNNHISDAPASVHQAITQCFRKKEMNKVHILLVSCTKSSKSAHVVSTVNSGL